MEYCEYTTVQLYNVNPYKNHVITKTFESMGALNYVFNREINLYLNEIEEDTTRYRIFFYCVIFILMCLMISLIIIITIWVYLFFYNNIMQEIYINKNMLNLLKNSFIENNKTLSKYFFSKDLLNLINN